MRQWSLNKIGSEGKKASRIKQKKKRQRKQTSVSYILSIYTDLINLNKRERAKSRKQRTYASPREFIKFISTRLQEFLDRVRALTSRFQSPPSISLGKLGQQIFQSPFPLPSHKLIPRAATQKSTARFVTPTGGGCGGAGVREARTSRVAVGK